MDKPPHIGLSPVSLSPPETRPASYSLFPGTRSEQSRRSFSRSWARPGAYLLFSAVTCAASLSWILTTASSQNGILAAPTSLPTIHEITPHLVIGGTGVLISVGLGIMSLLYWPRSHRKPIRRQDASLATYDGVTGLPSRRLYLVLLGQALTRAATTGRHVAVVVASLEHFRPLPTSVTTPNMTLVARVQAARIKSALQSHDAVSRLDDRIFAVLIDNLDSADKTISIAEKIQSTMSLPLLVEGQELLLSCRIACAVAPQDGTDAQLLLDAALQILSSSQNDDGSIFFLSDPTAGASAALTFSRSATPSSDHASSSLTANH